jgi:hypothetical protein
MKTVRQLVGNCERPRDRLVDIRATGLGVIYHRNH